jgi:hypothetical protein
MLSGNMAARTTGVFQVRRIPPEDKVVQLNLSPADIARLNTWLPEIASSLRPGAPAQESGEEIRIGNKSSLAIYPDGCWADYEADQ